MSSTADSFIVSLDVGSSSVRALVFDLGGRPMEGYTAQLPYEIRTSKDGGAEIDPERLAELVMDCLDEIHRQVEAHGMKVIAVASSVFWHSLCGLDASGAATTPLFHLLDTRCAPDVARVPDAHSATGCVAHSSYWPAKLLWIARVRPEIFRATAKWVSFPEYLFLRLFGRARVSTSMISATGLWDQNRNDYHQPTLDAVNVRREQVAPVEELDAPQFGLRPEFADAWPRFRDVPWFPSIGDGAANNAGCGAVSAGQFSLMAGTTGAMRAVVEAPSVTIPKGVWCYRLDRRRYVLGGALSNGGDVYAWLKRTLVMPPNLEQILETAQPGGHGLGVLPFFAGERSPYWRDDLRAAITGLTFSTKASDIAQAFLESVALGFREIFDLLSSSLGTPKEVVASGGALLKSPGWTQMMADALGTPVVHCTESEASSRGAVLWALEQLKLIPGLAELPASLGVVFEPRKEHREAWARLGRERRELIAKLYRAP